MKRNLLKALFAICLILGLASLTSAQTRFKVSSECISFCDRPSPALLFSFDYGKGVQITVTAGPTMSVVAVTKNNFSTKTEFEINVDHYPTTYFVNKATGKRVDSALDIILSRVSGLGTYCDTNKISGERTETGRFKILTELRRHLGLAAPTRLRRGLKRMNTNPKQGE